MHLVRAEPVGEGAVLYVDLARLFEHDRARALALAGQAGEAHAHRRPLLLARQHVDVVAGFADEKFDGADVFGRRVLHELRWAVGFFVCSSSLVCTLRLGGFSAATFSFTFESGAINASRIGDLGPISS